MTKNRTKKEQKKLNEQLFDAIEKYEMSADINFLKCLLEAGADPDIQNSNRQTALHATVTCNDINKTKLLLKYKADMYIKDKWGKTPFDISLLCNGYDVAELFISAGYVPSEEDMQKVKNHRLFKAIKENDLSAVKVAVEDGADVNATDINGTPLLVYTNFNDLKFMKYLLENGINLNMQNKYGWSLLHWISGEGDIHSVRLLLEFGADMTLKDKSGRTPFGIVCSQEKYDIAELFILNGYIPSESEFNLIKDKITRESLMSLAAQMQEHNTKLKEEAELQKFSYADEVIDM